MPAQRNPAKPTAPIPDEEIEFSEADVDAYIARNRDELNRSIAEARADLAAGRARPLENVLQDLRKRRQR